MSFNRNGGLYYWSETIRFRSADFWQKGKFQSSCRQDHQSPIGYAGFTLPPSVPSPLNSSKRTDEQDCFLTISFSNEMGRGGIADEAKSCPLFPSDPECLST